MQAYLVVFVMGILFLIVGLIKNLNIALLLAFICFGASALMSTNIIEKEPVVVNNTVETVEVKYVDKGMAYTSTGLAIFTISLFLINLFHYIFGYKGGI